MFFSSFQWDGDRLAVPKGEGSIRNHGVFRLYPNFPLKPVTGFIPFINCAWPSVSSEECPGMKIQNIIVYHSNNRFKNCIQV